MPSEGPDMDDQEFEKRFFASSDGVSKIVDMRERDEADLVDNSAYAAGPPPPFVEAKGRIRHSARSRKMKRKGQRRSYSTTAFCQNEETTSGRAVTERRTRTAEPRDVATRVSDGRPASFDRAQAMKELNPFQLVAEDRSKHGKHWYNAEEVKKRGVGRS